MVFLTFGPRKPFFEKKSFCLFFFFSFSDFFTFSVFLRPGIKTFVGSVGSGVDRIIFNYVFIQARSPGNAVIRQEVGASTTLSIPATPARSTLFFFLLLQATCESEDTVC